MVHTASLEEWLVPVVVFVIWAINAAISVAKKKNEEDEGESPQRPFTPLNHPANDDADRTRRIQEEIRRKIAERRGEFVPPQEEDAPAYPQEQHQPPPLRRTAERMPSPLEAPRPMTSPREVAHRRPSFAPDERSVYREQPEPRNDYLEQLEAQRRQIEESERQAEAIRRQARTQATRRKAKPILKKTTGAAVLPSIRGSLKRELRDPAAIRKAVLHYEILGTPVGMRRDGQLYPHWEV